MNPSLKMQKQPTVESLVNRSKLESDSRQGSKSYHFGPFAPVGIPKSGGLENNANQVLDLENLASTHKPQYHNQGNIERDPEPE